ncbi:Zinc finger MYM-type protein 1 [Merluccius polli]|uniref:Zinc finger MYM-type protein 1 n=1 Tax=Merluccius polli TaxID=89951 RepID=A0AA47P608_MERPO|nr:Zinc finger MYM-type protein 1 [Merluccius polli]
MHHMSEKIKKHEMSKSHMDSCLRFATTGRVNIATQLDEGYRLAVRRHNNEVSKNPHILNRLIQCVKFCGVFELALRGKDETKGSTNPGIFLGLVDFVAQLDEVFDEHLKNAMVFKGTSKMVQNELLERMLAVAWERIVEVKSARYLAIQADETTDVSTQTQLVLVLRYINDNHAVQERFFEFISISDSTSVSITSVLLERLNQLLADDNDKMKLVAQP